MNGEPKTRAKKKKSKEAIDEVVAREKRKKKPLSLAQMEAAAAREKREAELAKKAEEKKAEDERKAAAEAAAKQQADAAAAAAAKKNGRRRPRRGGAAARASVAAVAAGRVGQGRRKAPKTWASAVSGLAAPGAARAGGRRRRSLDRCPAPSPAASSSPAAARSNPAPSSWAAAARAGLPAAPAASPRGAAPAPAGNAWASGQPKGALALARGFAAIRESSEAEARAEKVPSVASDVSAEASTAETPMAKDESDSIDDHGSPGGAAPPPAPEPAKPAEEPPAPPPAKKEHAKKGDRSRPRGQSHRVAAMYQTPAGPYGQQYFYGAPPEDDPHRRSREEAEGAAYQARRDSVSLEMEVERRRRMEEADTLDADATAERVARRAWAAAQLESEYERRQREHARRVVEHETRVRAMRSRRAYDANDFVASLERAMAPQRRARTAVLDEVSQVVRSIWSHAECSLYGSCLTGLDLPSSDVDVVVRGLNCDPTPNPPGAAPRRADATPPASPASAPDSAERRPSSPDAPGDRGNGARRQATPPRPPRRGCRASTAARPSARRRRPRQRRAAAPEDAPRRPDSPARLPPASPAPPSPASSDTQPRTRKSKNRKRKGGKSSGGGRDGDGGDDRGVGGHKPNYVGQQFLPPAQCYGQFPSTCARRRRRRGPTRVVLSVKTPAAPDLPWVRELKAIETANIPVIKLLADPSVLGCPLPEFKRNRRRACSEDAAQALAETARACGDLPLPDTRRRPQAVAGDAAAADDASDPERAAPEAADGDPGEAAGVAPDHGGLASSRYALEAMSRWPELAPLMLVLKELLVQRGLNEPFTGGLSSYSLLLLVMTALLQAGVEPLEDPLPEPRHITPLEDRPEAEAPEEPRKPPKPPTSVREAWARLRDDPRRAKAPLRDGGAAAGGRRRPSLASRIRGGDALLWNGADARAGFDKDDDALGYLLTFFLEFFGRHFDPQRHAVSVLRGDAGIIAMAGPGYADANQWIQNVFAHCLCILESKGAAAALRDDSCNILSLVLSY
ncbi:RNA uridylyltransferase [Aureococcus anophagefferens]|nr:RNA uridylyltransferase [Aureococcus anophagefferens]